MRSFLPCLLLLTGCVVVPPMPVVMLPPPVMHQAPPQPSGWIGRTEAELAAALGTPDRVWDGGNQRVVWYGARGFASEPALVPRFGFGVGQWSNGFASGTAIGGGFGFGYTPASACGARFDIRDGWVVGAAPDCG